LGSIPDDGISNNFFVPRETNQMKHFRKFSTVNQAEIGHFSRLSEQWWDPNGGFKTLHQLNPYRMGWIRRNCVTHFNLDSNSIAPLKSLKILDIGCGGGLVSESFARLGGEVTGVDGSTESIEVAKLHSLKNPSVSSRINYLNTTIEELAVNSKESFDIVSCLEVVEHVDQLEVFMNALVSTLKPGGAIFLSTLNKTVRSYLLGILAAEYVLKIVPKGTHDWKKFISPQDLTILCKRNNIEINQLTGISYNPIFGTYSQTTDVGVNYMMYGSKL
jgi:2-polyprenyl-6-hydroxyphenyl methylase/3-demethylubiquinone-9 3-methyltransferase